MYLEQPSPGGRGSCQWPPDFPQMWASNFPEFDGFNFGDQPLSRSVFNPGGLPRFFGTGGGLMRA
ncbi:hypothetical protein, partial [Ensifer sp. 4252]|uniref:hypothetical protein n=1 Tax=Ensifer sp. 4252 TaxID=3373915 RepID=UPI003D1A889A